MGNPSKSWNEAEAPERGSRLSWAWIAAPFLILGIAACIFVFLLADHIGGGLAILGIILIPCALIVLILALRKGIGLLAGLRVRLTWWHWLWLMIFASALVFRVRGAEDIHQDPVDAWAVYRIILEFVVGSILFMRLALRRTSWIGSLFRGFTGVLACFAFVQLASTMWSVFPAWTFYKSCEYLGDVALLAAILATIHSIEDYKDLFDWTWTLYGLLLLSVWIGVVLWPRDALYPQGFKVGVIGVWLTGVMPHVSANDVGTFGAMIALVALSRLLPIDGEKRSRPWYGLLFTAGAVTMVLAQTRTAFAGFFLGIFLILLFSKRFALSALITFVVMPALLLSSLGSLMWDFLERGESERGLQTLSSRTVWWSFAWEKFVERPITGFGAYAAGRFEVMAQLGNSKTASMHSDYLEVIVGTGLWGMIPFLIALVAAWWFLTRYLRHSTLTPTEQQLAYEAIAVLGLLTVRSVFQSMLSWHPPLHYLVIIGYVEFLRRKRLEELPVPKRAASATDGILEPAAAGGKI
jgi:hypothetical protein